MTNETRQPRDRGRSSTSDILGAVAARPHLAPRIPEEWAYHHQVLAELRDRLVDDKQAQSQNAREEVSVFSEHMADAATDSYDRDWALAMASSTQNALYEIDQALNRLCSGTYGICEVTGQPIESERLKAIPWTRFSASAQAEIEAGGTNSRPHLGALGSYLDGNSDLPAPDEDDEAAPEPRSE